MRRTLLALIVATVAFLGSAGTTVSVVSASTDSPITGDADCNLAVDELDALGIALDVGDAGGEAQCLEFADVNCDGLVNIEDMLEILLYTGGLPPGDIPGTCPQIGSAAGLPALVFSIDEAIAISPETIPGIDGGPARPLAGVVDDDGAIALFVANEIIIVTDNTTVLNAFLAKWNATLVLTLTPDTVGIDLPLTHLVRLDTSGVNLAELADDLRALHGDSWGQFDVSSAEAAGLLAVAAGEAADGLEVDLNWVAEGGDLDQRVYQESTSGPDQWSKNPFDWPYMNRGSVQNIGVTDAWRAMNAAGTLDNRVTVGIMDGGFAPTPDFPAGFEMNGPTNVENPASCTGGSPCPWHGTVVTASAMGVPDNNFGVAGPAGPIADAVLTQSPSLDLFSILRYIFEDLPSTAWGLPDVLNISAGVGIPRELCLTGICLAIDSISAGLRALDVLLVSAAMNDDTNVDKERCIDLLIGEICYEKTTHVPCEAAFVVCVGGIDWDSTAKYSASNYGTDDSQSVDIFGPNVQFTSPTPDAGIERRSCGTSCASPFVAGVAALIMAANPDLNAGETEEIMMQTAHTESGDAKVPRWVNAYGAVILAMGGNNPPEWRIDFSSGDEYGGIPLQLRGTLSDVEDRPFFGDPYTGQPAVQWNSSLDGNFATGPFPPDLLLSYGTHIITATATDSGGLSITDSRFLEIIQYHPQVTIVNPLSGATFVEGQTIKFRATSKDLNRVSGQLNDNELQWSYAPVVPGFPSTPLGTGHLLSATLPEGEWKVQLLGTDDQGASSFVSVNVSVGPPPDDFPPEATIISAEYECVGEASFHLVGQASDLEDGTLTGASLVWTKTVSGNTTFVGTGEVLDMPVTGIPQNQDFTITLTATDSNSGTGSDIVSRNWACIT